MAMQYTITGNTYGIRDIIKDAGFAWNGTQWIGNQSAVDRWAKITTPSWSRADANRVARANVTIIATSTTASINALIAPANSIY